MTYLLAVFKSRTQTMKFAEILQRMRIPCTVINTPREASVDCGVSVRFEVRDFERVNGILHSERNLSFVGFYKVIKNGVKSIVTKI